MFFYPAAREEQFSLLGYPFALEAKLPNGLHPRPGIEWRS